MLCKKLDLKHLRATQTLKQRIGSLITWTSQQQYGPIEFIGWREIFAQIFRLGF